MDISSKLHGSRHSIAAILIIVVVSMVRLAPLLLCIDSCIVDFERFHGIDAALLHLQKADTHLNAWILAWVQHALVTDPTRIYDANIFHPLPGMLAGSEHLMGVAALLAPLRAFGAGAIALHQSALWISFPLTGVSTYMLTRWLTGSASAAALAGVIAVLMPWRLSELSHVQLLGTSFIPLVWLLVSRLCVDKIYSRRYALALFAVTLIQLLASYYLAYYLVFSLAVLAVIIAFQRTVALEAGAYAAGPIVAALVVFAVISLPYLGHGEIDGLIRKGHFLESSTLSAAWASIAPYNPLTATSSLPWRGGYATPPAVLLLALFSLPAAFSRRQFSTQTLWLTALGAFVLSLGTHLEVASWHVPLPAQLASYLVPGFADMRGPMRWGILIGVVTPVLAGIGLHYIQGTTGSMRRMAVTAIAAILVLAGVPWPRVPTALAVPEDSAKLAVYQELARLPSAPVLEVPWPDEAARDAILASRYMLASTYHWQPLLNGYSGWTPLHYDFLRRLGQSLPRRDTLKNLRRLTGLRWIVVHPDEMTAHELAPWDEALSKGTLVSVYGGATARIYEVVVDAEPYSQSDAVISTQPRRLTITGSTRGALALTGESGRLDVKISGPMRIELFDGDWLKTWISIGVTNHTDQPWPGIDPHPEGLVALRYRFVDSSGRALLEDLASLDADVPADATLSAQVLIEGHIPPGQYTLHLALIQQLGGEAVALPLESRTVAVRVAPTPN